jgi:hypothetical protein
MCDWSYGVDGVIDIVNIVLTLNLSPEPFLIIAWTTFNNRITT